MPITVRVAQHEARNVASARGVPATSDSQSVLKALNHRKNHEIGPILSTASGLQTSLSDENIRNKRLTVENHGLVLGALVAYNAHHHLVLRPEDVWFAVLTQFSFFVNAHAEELRSTFVPHKGTKGLVIYDPGQPDMEKMCRNMSKLIESNIVDAGLRDWINPSFTTTTMHDEVVASVIMMGTLQKYFEYVFDASMCGIPTVTLLGELSDWEDVQQRIERLSKYGEEPTRFLSQLRPILRHMVATFTRPAGDAEVADFWSRIIRLDGGSGPSTINGWMTAFCFWDEDGKPLGDVDRLRDTMEFVRRFDTHRTLDEVVYYEIDYDEVPAGFVSVPVKYINPDCVMIECKLLAGFVGFEATTALDYSGKQSTYTTPTESKKQPSNLKAFCAGVGKRLALCFGKTETERSIGGDQIQKAGEKSKVVDSLPLQVSSVSNESAHGTDEFNTVQPVTGWWMFEVKSSKETGMSHGAFYDWKMTGDWNGQVSTAHIDGKGEISHITDKPPISSGR